MAASELVIMFDNVACRLNHNVIVGATVAMTCTAFAPVLWREQPFNCPLGNFGWALAGIVLAIVLAFIYQMRTFQPSPSSANGEIIDQLGRSALIFIYLSMLFAFLVPHRLLQDNNALGLVSIITLITATKLADSFAYFIGKRFGTIKLAPKLSPGKTVQGALGAFIGGCAGTAIVIYIVAPGILSIEIAKPWWWFLAYGILVTGAGMVGDLAESLIKRDTQTKDSSSWLPGLGGILDIMDSLVFAAPVSFFLWIIADLPASP
jgi:phosphatidate cytidylyltransferase